MKSPDPKMSSKNQTSDWVYRDDKVYNLKRLLEQGVRDQLKQGSIRSFWRERSTEGWVFYCPLCAVKRAIPLRPRPGGFRHVGQIALTALMCTWLTWPIFGWKGLVSFLPLWTAFEVFYRMQVRARVVCTGCGFDPFLFMVNVPQARAQIDAFWRARFSEKGTPYPERSLTPPSS